MDLYFKKGTSLAVAQRIFTYKFNYIYMFSLFSTFPEVELGGLDLFSDPHGTCEIGRMLSWNPWKKEP